MRRPRDPKAPCRAAPTVMEEAWRNRLCLVAAAIIAALPASAAPARDGERDVVPGQNLVAIANEARPGDVLRVQAGEYRGGVLKQRGITIRGQGIVQMNGRLTLTGGGVVLEGASDVAISGNVFSGLKQQAVKADGKCRRIAITGNVMTNTQDNQTKQ